MCTLSFHEGGVDTTADMTDPHSMQEKVLKKTPAEIARAVLQELASRRIAPTPEAYTRLYREIENDEPTSLNTFVQPAQQSEREKTLRQMLSRLLSFSIATLLHEATDLSAEARELGALLLAPETTTDQTFHRLKQLTFQIELQTADIARQRELMMQLFSVVLENAQTLLKKDSWMSNQMHSIQDLFVCDDPDLVETSKVLKDMLYKQEQMHAALEEEKAAVRNIVMTFVERMGSMASTTDTYQQALNTFSSRITDVDWVSSQADLCQDILAATNQAQLNNRETQAHILAAQKWVHEAENRVFELEAQLMQMDQLVSQDHLTGSLNRRGMDEVLEKEMARSRRHNTPLCIALIDLDNFKKLNDTYGHTIGDEVLIHLVSTVKDILRQLDAIARFGGEEFVMILPETSADHASDVMVRVQREMTKRVFLHNSQRLLITFSAGVAEYVPGEYQESILKRADDALYAAKHAGKNRVVVADAVALPPQDA